MGRALYWVAGAGVVILGAYLLAVRQPTLQLEAAMPAPSGAPHAVVAPVPATSAHSPVGAAAVPVGRPGTSPSQRMRKEFADATDLRAFAYAAMARPHEGGYFYARHAANICGQDVGRLKRLGDEVLANELRESATVGVARLHAAEQFQRQCGSFAPGEVTDLVKQVNAKAASGEDPLLSAGKDTIDTLLRNKQWDQAGPLFERLARLNDPLLWTESQLFRFIVSSDGETRRTGAFYFDGKVYGPEEKGSSEVWSALELGFCGKGPCALDLRMTCLGGGFCGDHAALVKSHYFANGGTEEGWGRVLLLEERVRAGLAAGATEMFVQPKR